MNKTKLIEYLLGNVSPEDDRELFKLLEEKGVESELTELSAQIENIALSVPTVQPSKKLKDTIFAHIEKSGSEKFTGLTDRLATFFQLPIKRIKEILENSKDIRSSVWDKATIEGAYLYHFKAGGSLKDAHCGLILLKPQTKITKHEHLGEERMFVLQGEVATSNGETYRVGETAISKEGSSHTLISGNDSDCMFAVIANGGVRFEDL